MKINNIEVADWKIKEIAEAHNNLNKSYFDSDEYKKYQTFYILKDSVNWIINNEFSNNLKILDIGCGAAWQAVYLKKENLIPPLSYDGIDLSLNMCNLAKENFPEGNFYEFNICDNSFSIKYDIVLESAVLELVHDWKKALINMLRSSKKWIIFHRLFFKKNKTIFEQTKTYNNIPDIRFYIGMKDFGEIIEEEGFKIVKEYIWSAGYGTFILKKFK